MSGRSTSKDEWGSCKELIEAGIAHNFLNYLSWFRDKNCSTCPLYHVCPIPKVESLKEAVSKIEKETNRIVWIACPVYLLDGDNCKELIEAEKAPNYLSLMKGKDCSSCPLYQACPLPKLKSLKEAISKIEKETNRTVWVICPVYLLGRLDDEEDEGNQGGPDAKK